MNQLAVNWVRPGKQALVTGTGVVAQFRVVNVTDYPDSIVGHAWDGTDEAATDIDIAKPWELRRDVFDGRTFSGIAYAFSSMTRRSATKGTIQETQVIIPAYRVGGLIYAAKGLRGGVDVRLAGKALEWLDLNADGRAWARESSATIVADSATQGVTVANLQHNFGAERDPTTDDDAQAGYSIGSQWINVLAGTLWGCVRAAARAALWKDTTGGAVAGGRGEFHLTFFSSATPVAIP